MPLAKGFAHLAASAWPRESPQRFIFAFHSAQITRSGETIQGLGQIVYYKHLRR